MENGGQKERKRKKKYFRNIGKNYLSLYPTIYQSIHLTESKQFTYMYIRFSFTHIDGFIDNYGKSVYLLLSFSPLRYTYI